MLFEEGLDAAIRRHALLAEATRHAVSRWAEANALAFNIVRAEERANSVTHGACAGPRARPAQRLLSRQVRRRPRPRNW